MTKIMKGGVAYNSTANMVALTQAEYNSLSTAQKNNGNFYFIVDSDPSYFSAENIDYDNTDSSLTATSVQGAIDEVDNLIPSWIKQTPGTSISLQTPIVFYYYYADQWQAYVPYPFITKNDNYTINISSCVAENVGEIKSKLSILTKNANLFKIQTTKTMASLPNMYSVCSATIIYTITFA